MSATQSYSSVKSVNNDCELFRSPRFTFALLSGNWDSWESKLVWNGNRWVSIEKRGMWRAVNIFVNFPALSEISRGLGVSEPITILTIDNTKSTEFDEFVMEIHRLGLQTCIFNDSSRFFAFIEANLKGSLEVTSLIFHNPDDLIPQVKRFQSL